MEISGKMLYYNNREFNMSQAAELINRGLGRNKLSKLLKENGVIDLRNRPLPIYVALGYLTYKQPKERCSEDEWCDLPYSVPYIKPKGILWMQNNIDLGLSFKP